MKSVLPIEMCESKAFAAV